jgi:iron(III) transport system ATP-binding protein
MPDRLHPAIEIRGVSKRFGDVVALDNVAFTVAGGELFFLLGPSGCGKTTLLRILAGLETPDSGTVLFEGRDIAGLPPHARGAPMVFQNYALWPHLSVRENVAFGLVERRVPAAEIASRVREALQRVGLEGVAARMPGQLSGGQQQRVVLARALVLNPRIVLLDEPLSNLDAKLRMEMREEIEKLHTGTDITFVYVTHDQAEALALADRMAVMSAGRISAIGKPAELYNCPPNAFCAEFLGEANLVPGQVVAGDAGAVTVRTPLGAWQATPPPGVQLKPGSDVHCLIRPESLQPVPQPAAGWNSFEADVQHLRMNGSTVTVLLQAGGHSLKATLLTPAADAIKPGARLRWAAASANTVALPQAEMRGA